MFPSYRNHLYIQKEHLQPCQTSKMELLAIKVNGRKPLAIFAKSSILDV